MKSLSIFNLFTLFIFMTAISCRKEADPAVYYGEVTKLAYGDSYVDQFKFIWKNISTGYVFWDIDKTPWDDIYNECLPKLEELDKMVEAGKNVQDSVLKEIYVSAMEQMTDHHMLIYVANSHPDPEDSGYVLIQPGAAETEKRPEYIESINVSNEKLKIFLKNIESVYPSGSDLKVIEHEQITFNFNTPAGYVAGLTYSYNLFQLSDGRIVPYLWQNNAAFTPVMEFLGTDSEAGMAAAIIDHYFRIIADTPKEMIAGFILDNRSNGGGYQDDLDFLIGSYINEEVVIMQTRYKEGPGRLEHSVWTDYNQRPIRTYHRDITSENIPFVILTDLSSVSMGEIEPMVASFILPTAYIIGERTFGATGTLQPNQISLTYSGQFGKDDFSDKHFIYTSHFETQIGGFIYEGIGLEPDLKINRKDYNESFKPVLDAALEYCSNY